MKMFFSELAAAANGTLLNASADSFITGVSTDSRIPLEGQMFLAVPGEKFDGHDFLEPALKNGAALLCIERGQIKKLPSGAPALLVDSTVRAYRDIARAHRLKFNPVMVALTGSCGKTSTKEMIRAIFNEAYGPEHVLATEGNTNNHIGVPRNLLRLTNEHKACVIEIGTSHHGEIEPLARAVEPDAALIVSIGRCHLENLGSLDGVAREKSHVYKYLRENGTAVIPDTAAGLIHMERAADAHRVFRFGHNEKSLMETEYLGGCLNGSSFRLINHETKESFTVEWSLCGAHQAANAAGAAAAAWAVGVPMDVIARGLCNCTLPGLRMKHSEHFGAHWINDAYNANPDSMRATLQWLSEFAEPKQLTLVLGDMLEVGESSAAAHREILDMAVSRFPGAVVAAVGPLMTAAAKEISSPAIRTFPDSKACAAEIALLVREKGLVFLKASRGTHLEYVEPAE